jgi:hypothetical protein
MRLTLKELRAIGEALGAKTAGDMDDVEARDVKHYESAHAKISEEMRRREVRAARAGAEAPPPEEP